VTTIAVCPLCSRDFSPATPQQSYCEECDETAPGIPTPSEIEAWKRRIRREKNEVATGDLR
jgi:hypothetical protein